MDLGGKIHGSGWEESPQPTHGGQNTATPPHRHQAFHGPPYWAAGAQQAPCMMATCTCGWGSFSRPAPRRMLLSACWKSLAIVSAPVSPQHAGYLPLRGLECHSTRYVRHVRS